MDALTIHDDFELVRGLKPSHHAEIGPVEFELNLILGIERERRSGKQSANRTHRQAVDMHILRRVLPNPERLGDRTNLGITNAEILAAAFR